MRCAFGVPRFSPRLLLVLPEQFGRATSPEWLAAVEAESDELVVRARRALAFQQHQLALALEADIRERGITRVVAAAELGVPASTLGKKLRGHDPMYAEDLFAWVLHLDRVDLWPAPSNLNELLP
jgi:hypothetical protein